MQENLYKKCYDMIRTTFFHFAILMIILLVSTYATLIQHAHQTTSNDAHTLITVGTVPDAIKACKLHQPAIIMLDISSANLSCFADEFSKCYQQTTRPTLIILSQTKPPSEEILALGIGGFARYDDNHLPPLLSLITHAQKPTLAQQSPNQPTIITHTHRGRERIFIDDVLYCQSEQKYTKIHHKHGVTYIDSPLKSLALTYPSDFIRIHRHTLASVRHIRQISNDGTKLTLYGMAEPLIISRRCLPALRLRLANLGKI